MELLIQLDRGVSIRILEPVDDQTDYPRLYVFPVLLTSASGQVHKERVTGWYDYHRGPDFYEALRSVFQRAIESGEYHAYGRDYCEPADCVWHDAAEWAKANTAALHMAASAFRITVEG